MLVPKYDLDLMLHDDAPLSIVIYTNICKNKFEKVRINSIADPNVLIRRTAFLETMFLDNGLGEYKTMKNFSD